MNSPNTNNYTQYIFNFLQKEYLVDKTEKINLKSLSGDGSSRLFFKIKIDKFSTAVL